MSKHSTPGRFTWRELMTTDVERARAFYGELFNWKIDAGMDMGDGGTYFIAKLGDKRVAGLMKSPAPMSFWGSVVAVPDTDAAVSKAVELGGKVLLPPTTMPGVGRYATIADSDGAVLSMLDDEQGDPVVEMAKVSEFCWETLSTKDEARAKAFYTAVCGWLVGTGPGGMTTFGVDLSPQCMVADVQKAEGMPANWLTYVVVEQLEASRDRAVRLGATVIVPAVDIPTVGRIGVITDPTGAAIGLFQPVRS